MECVAFSPDGKKLATGSADKTVIIWDVAAGGRLATLSGLTEELRCLMFSPCGKYLLAGRGLHWFRRIGFGKIEQYVLGCLEVWSTDTWQNLLTVQCHDHDDDTINCLAVSSDRNVLATGSRRGTIRLWDFSDWLNRFELEKREVQQEALEKNKKTGGTTAEDE